jgi:murein DD-endopeptidase MepM/ murein hydrolase activator NlpD
MQKRKKITVLLIVGILIVAIGALGWFLACIFEGEPPSVSVEPLPEYLSGSQKFTVRVADENRGLRKLKISLDQEGRKVSVFEKQFPFHGILNRQGIHSFEIEVELDPKKMNLAQGRADLYAQVWDYSRRNGGDGNLSVFQHKMTVDTIPPAIRTLSRQHYINLGGTGLVVYRVSSDTNQSGVYVNDYYFPGFPASEGTDKETRVCYFAIPQQLTTYPSVYIWAKDKAGNRSTSTFNYHIRKKKFRTEKMAISDHFLNQVLPYFSFYPLDGEATPLQKFLKINRDLRKENAQAFLELGKKSSQTRLWEGPWLRLMNAAAMARFGDRRIYYYHGKEVDKETHLGADLASIAQSKVPAANNGRVIFAGRMGIYGNTIVLDHGQGLASSYSHLSKIDVAVGDMVQKGGIIGQTGQTGLAGGDHLHFAVMVDGIFVDPVEWWDSHWINDNITKKLALLEK